ncbi:gamma-glutamyltransferase [Alienimonas californiensis]|uniref:Gamma-glutamyltranspeptidase n=1 Tax=Alienimonas californiensis TaxID=2527989 RepID=A0A517PES5_9PLAN|nr:gamma-glutamyltransferase [Alienimonas californiensis]QDT17881.1 Gamma-glutamyltranspeptidase precursor [Alienimonas californiensis]
MCVSLLLIAALAQSEPAVPAGSGTFARAAVAADHPAAAAAGAEALRAGGNAVDAAAATSLALSVVRPYSCGLGGGGFLLFYDADGGPDEGGVCRALDYREVAPAAATRDMFLDDPEGSRRGGKAVAVPGTVAGLHFAQSEWGELAWADVCAPAVRLAREGVPLDEHDRAQRADFIKGFEANPALKTRFAAFWTDYLFAGVLPGTGEPVPSPQLALLERIAAEGPSAFYAGQGAASLVAAVQAAGGGLTEADLAAYKPRLVEPLAGTLDGVTLHVMPPPSSGGIAMLETLNLLTARERIAGRVEPDSAAGRHRLVEALKHSFADRAAFLGDPYHAVRQGTPLPTARLASPEYAAALAAKIDPTRTFPPAHYGRIAPTPDAGTSHLSVIDAAGNAVACTETINLIFGSLVATADGVVLNNEMDDFAAIPGRPNAFGLIQSEANAVGPGRVPLSSMSPTIGVRDGQAVLAAGASGGPRIITATLQTVLNRVRGGMSPAAAITAPRMHHQWAPNWLEVEPEAYEQVRRELEPLGHEVRERAALGAAQMAVRNADGTLSAAADPRKGGGADGF